MRPNFVLTENVIWDPSPKGTAGGALPVMGIQRILWRLLLAPDCYKRKTIFKEDWTITSFSFTNLFCTYDELDNQYTDRKIIDSFDSLDEFVAKYFVELL